MKLTINTIVTNKGVSNYLDADFSEEIDRGAAMLDQVLPGWEKQIDTRKLALSSGVNCVLGQLSDLIGLFPEEVQKRMFTGGAGYYSGLLGALSRAGKVELIPQDEGDVDYAAARYGFNIDLRPHVIDYDPKHFEAKMVPNGEMCQCCQAEEYRIVPISPVAKELYTDTTGWYWEQITNQWKDYLRDRLKVKPVVEIDKTVDELVAMVGAEPVRLEFAA